MEQFHTVRFSNFVLTTSPSDRTFVGQDTCVYIVCNILRQHPTADPSILVSKCQQSSSLYPFHVPSRKFYPCHSDKLKIFVVRSNANLCLILKPLSFVSKKCICLPFNNDEFVVFPL